MRSDDTFWAAMTMRSRRAAVTATGKRSVATTRSVCPHVVTLNRCSKGAPGLTVLCCAGWGRIRGVPVAPCRERSHSQSRATRMTGASVPSALPPSPPPEILKPRKMANLHLRRTSAQPHNPGFRTVIFPGSPGWYARCPPRHRHAYY